MIRSRPNHKHAILESVGCYSFMFLQGQRANWRRQISSYTYQAVLLDKVTVSGFMFAPLPHITRIMQIFKILDNLWKILHTDISNGIPCPFVFLWPYKGLEIQRGNQPLSWYISKLSFGSEDMIFILSRLKHYKEMPNLMYFSPFLISVCLLTLQQPQFFMFAGVNSPSVKISSHNIFWVHQPWYIDGGVATARSLMFITYV